MRRAALLALSFPASAFGCELVIGSDDYALRPNVEVADGAADASTEGAPAVDASAEASVPATGDVVILASGQSGPRGIALTATDVYWTNFDANAIAGTGKSGDGGVAGALTGPDHTGCLDIAAYGGTLAWLNTKLGQLVIKPFASAGVTVSNCGSAMRMSQDANDLFYTDLCSNGTNLWRVPKTGTKSLVSQALTPDAYTAIASDGLSIYVAKPAGIAQLPSAPDAGVFAPTSSPIVDLTVDSTRVFWLSADGTVNSKEKSGSTPTKTLATGQAGLARLALYQDVVIWTAGGATSGAGFVAYAPRDGSQTARVIASGLNEPFGIAVDDSGVYFTNVGDGTIAKIPWL